MTPPPARPRAALVFNPLSGSQRVDALHELHQQLRSHVELDVWLTSKECDAQQCARMAVETQPDMVLACGGDGTVSAVASTLVGSGVPLGVIPLGTANSVASALGIPMDMQDACNVLHQGRAYCVDTLTCNGRTSVLLAAVGFHAEAVADTPRENKCKWGALAYVATGLELLARAQPFDVVLETEEHTICCKATAITAANMAPGRSLLAQGPDIINPTDGKMDVTVVVATSLLEAVMTGAHLLHSAWREEHVTRDNVGYLSCRRLRITATPPQRVVVDGEDMGTTPVQLHCKPQSLWIITERPPHGAVEADAEKRMKLEGLPGLRVSNP